MQKLVAIALWAGLPFLGQPLWGQAPSVGVKSGHDQKQQSQLAKSNPKADQRGTKDAPLVVDTKGHQSTKEEAAQEKREKADKDFTDAWTFRASIAVAGFTGILVVVGIAGVCAAIRTLNAIEAQVNVMEAGTRPWIGMEEKGGIADPLAIDSNGRIHTIITVTIRNYGNYPASIKNVFSELIAAPLGHAAEIISSRIDMYMSQDFPTGHGPASTLFPGGLNRHMNSAFSQCDATSEEGSMVFIVGIIQYADPAGNPHRTVFSYSYQAAGAPRAIIVKCVPLGDMEPGIWTQWRTVTD